MYMFMAEHDADRHHFGRAPGPSAIFCAVERLDDVVLVERACLFHGGAHNIGLGTDRSTHCRP